MDNERSSLPEAMQQMFGQKADPEREAADRALQIRTFCLAQAGELIKAHSDRASDLPSSEAVVNRARAYEDFITGVNRGTPS